MQLQEVEIPRGTQACISTLQTEITERMRAILISWLVQVHVKFHLLPETLYITKELIDRFTELRKIRRADYQLVGVAAMLIACKYEEIYVPEVQQFIEITDDSYTREQILK